MSVQKASIAFAGLAPLPPAGTHCSRRRRPKLLPEEVQALGEKAGAYMEERDHAKGSRCCWLGESPVCATQACGEEVLQ